MDSGLEREPVRDLAADPVIAGLLQFLPVLAASLSLLRSYRLVPEGGPALPLFMNTVIGTGYLLLFMTYVGGAGYLYLRRWGRAVAALLGYSGLLVVTAYLAVTHEGVPLFHRVILGWCLVTIALSFICATDAWKLAQAGKAGRRLAGCPEVAGVAVAIALTLLINFFALLAVNVVTLCYFGPTCI
jgi:hypothetical protein